MMVSLSFLQNGYFVGKINILRNLEQARIKVKAGLYVHIINFVTSYQLRTVNCFYVD